MSNVILSFRISTKNACKGSWKIWSEFFCLQVLMCLILPISCLSYPAHHLHRCSLSTFASSSSCYSYCWCDLLTAFLSQLLYDAAPSSNCYMMRLFSHQQCSSCMLQADFFQKSRVLTSLVSSAAFYGSCFHWRKQCGSVLFCVMDWYIRPDLQNCFRTRHYCHFGKIAYRNSSLQTGLQCARILHRCRQALTFSDCFPSAPKMTRIIDAAVMA